MLTYTYNKYIYDNSANNHLKAQNIVVFELTVP